MIWRETSILLQIFKSKIQVAKRCAFKVSVSYLKSGLCRKKMISILKLHHNVSVHHLHLFTSGNTLWSAVCFFRNENYVFYDEEYQLTDRMNKEKKSKLLHRLKTFSRNPNIWEAATQFGGTKILAKFSEGYMMACEPCYHKVCMKSFKNRHRGFVNKESKANQSLNKNTKY